MSEGQLGNLLRVVPERERHMVELQWSVPSEVAAYRQAPCAYLSHLLGCASSQFANHHSEPARARLRAGACPRFYARLRLNLGSLRVEQGFCRWTVHNFKRI